MAVNTDLHLQNQVIYSVYVRAHTPEGTFRAVIPDLDRIKALGTDIIWFLPTTAPSTPPTARWTISRHLWTKFISAA